MLVPVSWLRAYCDPGGSTADVAERLGAAGTEVERVERVGVGSAGEFVVGKVVSAERHPDADRLSVCRVDDGSGTRTIVCGAPNVAAGQTVAVGLPGAVMAGGQRLEEAELRGVTSSGMILAEDEVGLGDDHSGVIVLPDELPAGAPLAEHLQIADDVLDLEITPNRPDCLGVYGVARELHAATGAALADDPGTIDAEPRGDDRAESHASVEIADPDVCLRFTARVFEDVRVGPSPLWLKARLSAAGQRPISNVVDVTNYVMLCIGQPLHAFDLDEVRGRRIVVRRGREGEAMTTLDGERRELDPDMALVCDAEGPSGIAGVMGGQVSEVSDRTTRVLMEAATWVGPNVMRTSSRLGLRSEAGARFEKQLHPDLAMAAQRLAARLMVEVCGARLVPGTLNAYPEPREPRVVRLRVARLRSLLGEPVPLARAGEILRSLGFGVKEEASADGDEGALDATVPSFRDGDVQREADLIEEVARVNGLDRLPVTLPARRRAMGRLTPAQRLRRRLEDALRDRGLLEIVAYSFTAPDTLGRLRLEGEPVLEVANPLSADQRVMRPLLLPGLLDAVAHNAARGRPGVGLFESAHVYRRPLSIDPGGSRATAPASGAGAAQGRGALAADERHHIGALMTEAGRASWRRQALPPDYYAARALLEGMLSGTGVEWRADPDWPLDWPFLHPGRSATVVAGGEAIGWLGEVHPAVTRDWEVPPVAGFEVDADALARLVPATVSYRQVSTFPAVLQDIAVVVDEGTAAADVERAVRDGGGDLLESVSIFDVYRGDQVGEGRKSLAMGLEFRAADRTLTDDDVAEARASVESRLAEIGGRLRA